MSTKPAYRYMLPGPDEIYVKVQGFYDGFLFLPYVSLVRLEKIEQDNPGRTVKIASLKLASDENLNELVGDLLTMRLEEVDDDGIACTNDTSFFQLLYLEHCKKGYFFSFHAMYLGLWQIVKCVEKKLLLDLCYRFAWEKYMQQSIYDYEEYAADHDKVIDRIVRRIHKIYKHYQAHI